MSAPRRIPGEERQRSSLRELWDFFGTRKRWWMLPIVAVLLALGILVMLSGTAAAPFVYTLF